VGAVLGLLANWLVPPDILTAVVEYPQALGDVFLRLLSMLVIPLLFSALVLGIAELELKQLGCAGILMIAYTVIVSAIAVFIGVGLVNLFQPGAHMQSVRSLAADADPVPVDDKPWLQVLVEMVPKNVIESAASNQMLAVIVFSLLFGIALTLTPTDGAKALKNAIQGIYDVTMKLIAGVLFLMPIGVLALVFAMTARLGLGVLVQLAGYVGVVLLGLAIHMFVVYSASVAAIGGMNPIRFFVSIQEAIITAFSTASSNATLPTALRVADEKLKLPRQVSRFVLTAGSAMNQNGTALFEGVTVLFLAQLYGVPLDFFQQVTIVVICILGGIGTAGVPAGSIPVIAMMLEMYGIPSQGLGLIIGINHPLDMSRTVLNVTGDLAAAVCVSRFASPSKDERPPETPAETAT
jgi:DAACS family dicarboxylate/amino acid:cation (Na+ or H+) symporter